VHLFDGAGYERPGVSHLVNILFYLAVVLLLYRILRRLLRDYSMWFPFIIAMLFIAHPVHTEVVASLKNRDELLSMLFSLWTLHLLIRYADTNKVKFLVIGLLLYIVAFLAKPTALAWWFIYPLTLYFFTSMHWKKIIVVFALLTLMIMFGGLMPFWFLDRVRDFSMVDNPLYFEDNIWVIIGTGLMSVGYYVKLLVFPHPLLYYYGYDMIPIVNLGNIWVMLTLVFHLGLLGIAIWKFKEKSILSYGILFYLVTIPMYANIYRPVPGIIGERFLLVPSVAFVIILAWLIFKLFKAVPEEKIIKPGRILAVAIFTAIILIPYSYKVVDRNKDWYSQLSLYEADMDYLENSVKAHDLMGTTLMRKIEIELSKPVNVAKFIMPDIRKAIGHFNRATEIYPAHASSWKNLGMIYNHPRIGEHLAAEGDTAQFLHFKRSAIKNFKRSLEFEPGDGKALFNLGYTYENVGEMDSAVYFYRECINSNPQIVNPRSRLANLMFMQGRMDEALELNKQIIRIDPNEALPYVNFGNYYMIIGDTTKAVANFEEAALRNARPEVFAFLSQYYREKGNSQKAREYSDRYNMAIQQLQ
jgi:tetratricopeptide (TPR) repeat protein